ncbi:hypothetical protein JCM13664_09240 [Methylothermus subterraneus]
MSGLPVTYRLWITPLSPVHMGTDEDYVPTNYIIEDDALFEFDAEALLSLPEADRRALDRILSGAPAPRMIEQVQAFFYQRRERLIPKAVNLVRVSPGIADLYQKRVGKAANLEAGGERVYNRLEIERAAYHPADRRLYLPGSGLKGAIRTALLDRQNRSRSLPPDLKGDRGANQKLQERLLQGSFHTDPLRLVQVSDCRWCGPEELNSAEVWFAVNRKKQPVTRNGQEVRSQAEQGNLYQLLECAAPFRVHAFCGSLTLSDVRAAGEHSDLPKLRFGLDEIAKACNAFYRPIFEHELKQLKAREFLDESWRQTVQTLLDDPGLQKRLSENRTFLLRVGRHSGAEAVTLNGVRKIKILQGRGQPPAWEAEAKTWWLAAREEGNRRGLIPFGWLLIEIGEEPPPWETARRLLEPIMQEQSAWLKAVEARRRALAERLEPVLRTEAERAAAEAERRRREEERATRLAAMSEEEKRIEKVRTLLERDRQANRKEPGGELNDQRLKLLEAALSWSDAALRRQAAELLEETARFLPWAKKRKEDIREKIARLRG